ncbi:MAG: response regulator [Pirellulales bacterium]
MSTVLAELDTVHLVDDDPQFLSAVSLLLRSRQYAVRQYDSGDRFLELYQPAETECLLIDLRMPGSDGLDVQSEMAKRRIRIPVLIVTAFADTPCVVAAMRNGAIDVIEKPVEKDVLIRKIEDAFAHARVARERAAETNRRIAALTPREHEVLELIYAAKTTHGIARELDISPKTVEKHRVHIFDKLGVDNVPELMKLLFACERSVSVASTSAL